MVLLGQSTISNVRFLPKKRVKRIFITIATIVEEEIQKEKLKRKTKSIYIITLFSVPSAFSVLEYS